MTRLLRMALFVTLLATTIPGVADESPSSPVSPLHSDLWSYVEREDFDSAAALMVPLPPDATGEAEENAFKVRAVYSAIIETMIRELGGLQERTRVGAAEGDVHWLRYEVELGDLHPPETDSEFETIYFETKYAYYGVGVVESSANEQRVRSIAFGIPATDPDALARATDLTSKVAIEIERASAN